MYSGGALAMRVKCAPRKIHKRKRDVAMSTSAYPTTPMICMFSRRLGSQKAILTNTASALQARTGLKESCDARCAACQVHDCARGYACSGSAAG